ncbi:uncharacterized protein AMSG_06424 [Thecamonas trahens ATCC 50062]|uniref:Uncharacterized protein n=1 Tax=Thecamonas trahens ATCC 50062 TaxID=461836 RepID=A0A0L0DDG8_THETB|nr:hypothetical protein AMSG_06424 [Thecamonas trahens ATCC 50062]KNC50265.1 hypothetical protein AMSG_06424 [Thecamonas trahens ATCC 50062]|eukprot:XP_013757092.1 hypothetical protein AMSG_06424 [Thecamonas trahens ATCC 50062]
MAYPYNFASPGAAPAAGGGAPTRIFTPPPRTALGRQQAPGSSVQMNTFSSSSPSFSSQAAARPPPASPFGGSPFPQSPFSSQQPAVQDNRTDEEKDAQWGEDLVAFAKMRRLLLRLVEHGVVTSDSVTEQVRTTAQAALQILQASGPSSPLRVQLPQYVSLFGQQLLRLLHDAYNAFQAAAQEAPFNRPINQRPAAAQSAQSAPSPFSPSRAAPPPPGMASPGMASPPPPPAPSSAGVAGLAGPSGAAPSEDELKSEFTAPTSHAMVTNGAAVQQALQNMHRQATQYASAGQPMLRNYFVSAANMLASATPLLPYDIAFLDKRRNKHPPPPVDTSSGGCCVIS